MINYFKDILDGLWTLAVGMRITFVRMFPRRVTLNYLQTRGSCIHSRASRHSPKLDVAGSIPVSRSRKSPATAGLFRFRGSVKSALVTTKQPW